ncbi:MAG: DUF1552 domain-containing protein [Planctomycetaceae bacterium]|nr:DUF1552 domain-containing protein [Planctomycetaceae bacterium]
MPPIFNRSLSRRTILRGAGAALALPFLDAMVPALPAAAGKLDKPPLRAAFLFMPNGVRPDHWTPPGDAEQFDDLMPMMRSLTNVRDQILLLENLWNEKSVGRNGHWPKVPVFLSGGFVVRTAGRDLDVGGVSIDQVIADKVGHKTSLPSIELGVDQAYTGVDNVGGGFSRIYGSHIAWRDPQTPVPKEIIPRLAFDRLFRTGPAAPVVSGFTTRQPAVTDALARDDTSVLDLVLEEAQDLKRQVGASDRGKLDEYLESVRSVERRIENSLQPQLRWINAGRFDVPRPGPGIPESHPEHVRLMLDILMLSFWSDSTRVGTFMFGNAQTGRNFNFLDGVNGSFHGLSHHRNEDKTLAQYTKIGTWHVDQVAYLLEKMQALDEGGTSLLDNSIVLFGSTIRDGNRHDEKNLPLLLAGKGQGTIRPGRRLRAPQDTPLCNLYLTLLDRFGVELESFGDSTGRLEGLT